MRKLITGKTRLEIDLIMTIFLCSDTDISWHAPVAKEETETAPCIDSHDCICIGGYCADCSFRFTQFASSANSELVFTALMAGNFGCDTVCLPMVGRICFVPATRNASSL